MTLLWIIYLYPSLERLLANLSAKATLDQAALRRSTTSLLIASAGERIHNNGDAAKAVQEYDLRTKYHAVVSVSTQKHTTCRVP